MLAPPCPAQHNNFKLVKLIVKVPDPKLIPILMKLGNQSLPSFCQMPNPTKLNCQSLMERIFIGVPKMCPKPQKLVDLNLWTGTGFYSSAVKLLILLIGHQTAK